MTTLTTDLLGPYAEARQWLVNYMQRANFKNDVVDGTLKEDWTPYEFDMASYLLGCLWGRLRQMDSSLETATEYGAFVMAELKAHAPENDGQGET